MGPSRLPTRFRLAAVLACVLALLTAPAAVGATYSFPPNGSFDTDASGWTQQTSCPLLCSVLNLHALDGGGSTGVVRTTFETLLGLLGTTTGTGTWTSPSFTHSGFAPESATLSVRRRAILGSLLSVGGSASWRVRLINETTGTATTIVDQALTGSDPSWETLTFPVSTSLLTPGDSYRIELRSLFSAAVALLSGIEVRYDDVDLSWITDQLPVPVTGSAVDVGETTAGLAGTLNPSGLLTSYRFEWGAAADALTNQTTATSIGSGLLGVAVGTTLTALEPGTTYFYRLVGVNGDGEAAGAVQSFTTLRRPDAVTGAATSVTGTGATLGAEVTPHGQLTSYRFEYGPTAAYGSATAWTAMLGLGSSPVAVSAPVSGLQPGTTYHYRVVATSAVGTAHGADGTFTTPLLPGAATAGADMITASTARLLGSVTPNGLLTAYRFQWGTTPAYGSLTPLVTGLLGGTQPAQALLENLAPGVTYHYRLVATSLAGTTYGPPQTVTTLLLPGAATRRASNVGATTATLRGEVTPNGVLTTYSFEWGPTAAYGSTTPERAAVGIGLTGELVEEDLAGLAPETTYHYRLVATSLAGTVTGPGRTFTTLAAAGGEEPPPGGGEPSPGGGGETPPGVPGAPSPLVPPPTGGAPGTSPLAPGTSPPAPGPGSGAAPAPVRARLSLGGRLRCAGTRCTLPRRARVLVGAVRPAAAARAVRVSLVSRAGRRCRALARPGVVRLRACVPARRARVTVRVDRRGAFRVRLPAVMPVGLWTLRVETASTRPVRLARTVRVR